MGIARSLGSWGSFVVANRWAVQVSSCFLTVSRGLVCHVMGQLRISGREKQNEEIDTKQALWDNKIVCSEQNCNVSNVSVSVR